jgi:hypothetical protein
MIRSHEQAVKVIFHRIAGGAVVSPGKSSTAHNFYLFFPILASGPECRGWSMPLDDRSLVQDA